MKQFLDARASFKLFRSDRIQRPVIFRFSNGKIAPAEANLGRVNPTQRGDTFEILVEGDGPQKLTMNRNVQYSVRKHDNHFPRTAATFRLCGVRGHGTDAFTYLGYRYAKTYARRFCNLIQILASTPSVGQSK